MRWLNKLVPPFLNHIDHYLLTHYPAVWVTRVHMVLSFGIAMALLLIGISFALPMHYWEESEIIFIVALVSIVSVLSLIVWVVYLLRFNPFKRFADDNTVRKPGRSLSTFLLYFLVLVVFCLWPFIPPAIETYRTYHQISADEVVSDINELNLKVASLEFKSGIIRFKIDTAVFHRDISAYTSSPDEDSFDMSADNEALLHFDISMLQERLAEADSNVKWNDSTYLLMNLVPLRFVSCVGLQTISTINQLDNKQLYYLAQKANKGTLNKEAHFLAIGRIAKKYDHNWSEYAVYEQKNRREIRVEEYEDINKKYGLYAVADKMNGVEDRMTRWEIPNLVIYLHVVLYISLLCSLLVFIYRHNTNKIFFLSFLAALLLFVLSSLFLALLQVHADLVIWYVCLLYLILFGVLAYSNFRAKYRSLGKGIAINLFLLSIPFLPLLLTSIYYEHLYLKYPFYEGKEWKEIFGNKTFHLMLSELAGLVLLIVLLEPCFKKLYTRWYALPEE